VPKVFNLRADDWERSEDRPGWRSRDTSVAGRIGAQLIGGSMYELEPGQRLWPYHTHYANEEWLLVVRGRPTLRTVEGEHDLIEGDVVAFPRGEEGEHQVINRTEVPVRVLMLSTMIEPDVVHYPDSGKWSGKNARGERVFFGRPGPPVDYWDGED